MLVGLVLEEEVGVKRKPKERVKYFERLLCSAFQAGTYPKMGRVPDVDFLS